MKRSLKTVMLIDGIILALSIALTVYFNNSKAYGVAALTDLGGFAVCLALSGAALLALVVLGIIAFATRRKK